MKKHHVKSTLLAVLAIVAGTSCQRREAAVPPRDPFPHAKCAEKAGGECTVYDPSLFELIARRDWYHRKVVRVQGVLGRGFEESGLYVSGEDYRNKTPAVVWLHTSDCPRCSSLATKWVIVEGTFDAFDRGHMGLYSGGITVRSLEEGVTRPLVDTPANR